jgi:hypothetical protein
MMQGNPLAITQNPQNPLFSISLDRVYIQVVLTTLKTSFEGLSDKNCLLQFLYQS